MTADQAWASDPDELERLFHQCLGRGDVKGVEAALIVLAPVDPRRAQRLYDALRIALAVLTASSPAELNAALHEMAAHGHLVKAQAEKEAGGG